jgi:hypothetical protein
MFQTIESKTKTSISGVHKMDVIILLAFVIPLCAWGYWVSKRGETKDTHHNDNGVHNHTVV